MTDLHLGPTPDFKCRSLETFKSLQSVLDTISADGRGDYILLLTGDIASDGQPEAYQLVDQLLSSKGKQMLWLPGNHDRVDLMPQNLKNFPYLPLYETEHWAILMLNSSIADQPGGVMSNS